MVIFIAGNDYRWLVAKTYQSLYSSGVDGEDSVDVYLYPWSQDETSYVSDSGIATYAIKDAMDQLYSWDAIEGYTIHRWYHENSNINFPTWGDIDNCTYEEIWDNWWAFLELTGTDANCGSVPPGKDEATLPLPSETSGVHQLIHSGSTGCNETAGDYAPAGAGGGSGTKTAFREATVAWSPVCGDDKLSRAAAAQETVHMCMHTDYDGTDGNCSDNDSQHMAGTINYNSYFNQYECTPMLTYHWDDDENPDCYCPTDADIPDTHRVDLTTCTKNAVERTKNNLENIY